jgi:hypothetical protein
MEDVMWKAVALATIIAAVAPIARAQTVTDPGEIASRLRFWSQESGDPVYYGEVRNVDRRTMRPLGHYQCLAIAFIRHANGVFQYAHKMWSKSSDGSCHYENVTALRVGNHGACVRDTNAGFGRAVGTARMTKDNIDVERSIFRTIDTNTRRVGETAACVPPRGVGAGLLSMRIENGRFKVITNRPLSYDVSLEVQDPRNPPRTPVF